jgi:hypothetical protein
MPILQTEFDEMRARGEELSMEQREIENDFNCADTAQYTIHPDLASWVGSFELEYEIDVVSEIQDKLEGSCLVPIHVRVRSQL